MKNRTLIMGICAVVFATASAFTSVSSPLALVDAWVEVRTSDNPNLHCINTGIKCENTGEVRCIINVFNDQTSAFVPTNGRTSSCAILTNTTESAPNYNPTTIDITGVTALQPLP